MGSSHSPVRMDGLDIFDNEIKSCDCKLCNVRRTNEKHDNQNFLGKETAIVEYAYPVLTYQGCVPIAGSYSTCIRRYGRSGACVKV
jgi:hypothetical protein